MQTPITVLPGIGEKKAAAFRKLGIHTLGDLLSYFPRKYDDRSRMVPIAMAEFFLGWKQRQVFNRKLLFISFLDGVFNGNSTNSNYL